MAEKTKMSKQDAAKHFKAYQDALKAIEDAEKTKRSSAKALYDAFGAQQLRLKDAVCVPMKRVTKTKDEDGNETGEQVSYMLKMPKTAGIVDLG